MRNIIIANFLIIIFPFLLHGQRLDFVMDMVHNNPGEAPFVTKYNDPFYLKNQGFNAAVVQWHVQTALTYDDVEKFIIPINSDERKWIEQKREKIKKQFQPYKSAELNVYAFTDFLVFPKSIWDKYGNQIEAVGQKAEAMGGSEVRGRKPDIQREMTQKLLIAQIDEIFSFFPELDGIVLRFGETYLQDTPFHRGGSPISNDYKQSISDQILFINIQ